MYQGTEQARNNATVDKNKWIRCVYCGHKLGKIIKHEGKKNSLVEIKCHSCKTINLCAISNPKEV